MTAIRHYHNAGAVVLGDIPGGTAFLKIKPRLGQAPTASPVDWLGFICKTGARRLRFARSGKLVASYVTNGDFLAHEWKPLRADQYVVCIITQISDHKFGAFAIVDKDGWPLVRSETSRCYLWLPIPKEGGLCRLNGKQQGVHYVRIRQASRERPPDSRFGCIVE